MFSIPMGKKATREPQREIPVDVTPNILVCLPVKSLCRFRCVCKSWYSLISSPLFRERHDLMSQQNPLLLLTQKGNYDEENRTINLHLSTYNPIEAVPLNKYSTIKLPHDWPRRPVTIIQSCQQFVCLVSHDNVFLYNPSIQKLIPVPPPPFRGKTFDHCYGFGYAESTREFKIVKFSCDNFNSYCEIFTLGKSQWKTSFPAYYAGWGGIPFLHGALHLPPKGWGRIAAFNVDTEKYKLIRLPEYHLQEQRRILRRERSGDQILSELGGSLCLTLNFGTTTDLWLLKDYDNQEWIKQYRIDMKQLLVCSSSNYDLMKPLVKMSNGNIWINLTGSDGNTELVCYDPENNVVTQRVGNGCSATFYVDRFVPLNNVTHV